MPWLYLILAGFFEVSFTTCLKLSEQFSKWGWTLAFAFCAILSFVFLSKATQHIALGTSYAVWTGIGAAGTALIGILYFNEAHSWPRILFISTLILSIIGLKWVSH